FLATPPPAIYPLSLHDALPIWPERERAARRRREVDPMLAQPSRFVLGARAPADLVRRRGIGRLAEPACLRVGKRVGVGDVWLDVDRKSTRLNSSHGSISYAVFC